MPFGFDAPFWRLMGLGIDWMILVAQWVANLPGAVGRIAAFGTGPLLLVTVGLAADLPVANAAALERRGAGCDRVLYGQLRRRSRMFTSRPTAGSPRCAAPTAG